MHRSYKSIKVWEKADELFDMVCEDVASWPKHRIAYSIALQLLNAVGSISANIAEGYGRGSSREFIQFLKIARGSSEEADNWLYKASKRDLITKDRYEDYSERIEVINKMINSFISKLRNQSPK